MSSLQDAKAKLSAEMAAFQVRLTLLDRVTAFVADLNDQGLWAGVEIDDKQISINIDLTPPDLSKADADQPVVNPWFGDDVHAVDALDAEIDALMEESDADEFLTELPEVGELADGVDADGRMADADYDLSNMPQISLDAPVVLADGGVIPASAPAPAPTVDDGQIAHPTPAVVAAPRPVLPKAPVQSRPVPARLIPPAEKSAEWTPGMVARLRQLRADGVSHAAIAKEMSRSEKAVGLKITRLNAADRAAAVPATDGKPAPKVKHSPADALTHRLDKMEGSKLWPMSLNLQLAVHAKAGKKMSEICILLGGGLTQEDVSAQLAALCPNRARIGALDEVIAALRDRVET